MCPRHSWQFEVTQNLFFHIPLLHTPSKIEIMEGLGRLNTASFRPYQNNSAAISCSTQTQLSGPSFSSAPEKSASFCQRKTETQNGREVSNVDKQSLNDLRNMNHFSDVLIEPNWRTNRRATAMGKWRERTETGRERS